jgi:hypothetical protein
MHSSDILHDEGEQFRAAPGFWGFVHALMGATRRNALAHEGGQLTPRHWVPGEYAGMGGWPCLQTVPG